MGLKVSTNKNTVNNRARFQGTVNFKNKTDALLYIDAQMDAAKSVPDLKEFVREFSKEIVNVVFDSMGIE